MGLPNLEHDLIRNVALVERVQQDRDFAEALYGALCNNEFRHTSMTGADEPWSCSWRYAGGVVAGLHDRGGDYMDYYCTGNEGQVTDDVRQILQDMGWTVQPIQ